MRFSMNSLPDSCTGPGPGPGTRARAQARDPGPQLWTADFKKNASWKKMTCYISEKG